MVKINSICRQIEENISNNRNAELKDNFLQDEMSTETYLLVRIMFCTF